MIEGTSDKIETDLFDRNFNLRLSGIVSEINTNKGYMKIRVNSNTSIIISNLKKRKYRNINR